MWAAVPVDWVRRGMSAAMASAAVSVSDIESVKVGEVVGIVVERRGRRGVVGKSGVEKIEVGPGERGESLRGEGICVGWVLATQPQYCTGIGTVPYRTYFLQYRT